MIDKLNYVQTNVNNKNNNNTTVLFLHGWGQNIDSFFLCQKLLSQYYDTINIDFLGFGKSASLEYPFDTYLYALSIYDFLVKKNITEIIIIAHSFGGRIAVLLSSIFNIKVTKMILVSSAGIKTKNNIKKCINIRLFKIVKWLVKKKCINQNVLKYFGSSDYKQTSGVMRQTFISIVNQDLARFLSLIKTPTLLVWGKNDKQTPIYMAKKFNKGIKSSKLIIYKNASHFSHKENFYEFYEDINYFLDNVFLPK